MTTLADHRRGDTFVRTFTLASPWTGATFTGGVKWTLRAETPASSVVTDADAAAQASVAAGEIAFVGAVGTITIAASVTTTWPTGSLLWDLQGVVAGTPSVVYTIDEGRILIRPDVTRSA
jgi:hypothetical protein